MTNRYFYDKFENVKNFIPSLLTSILILIIFYFIANYYKNNIINKSSDDKNNVNLIYYQISEIIYYIIIFVGIVFAASSLGFNVAALVTIFATFGLAIGFALQSSLQNIISGIFISIYKLFKIGDIIKIVGLGNTNPTIGKITDFNLGYVTIKELKTNIKTIIPNSIVYGNLLSNYGPEGLI
jgi:small conductance mechanosensitive channel